MTNVKIIIASSKSEQAKIKKKINANKGYKVVHTGNIKKKSLKKDGSLKSVGKTMYGVVYKKTRTTKKKG